MIEFSKKKYIYFSSEYDVKSILLVELRLLWGLIGINKRYSKDLKIRQTAKRGKWRKMTSKNQNFRENLNRKKCKKK